MSRPLVSVIVPVYNAEKTLSKCVESILSQTYKNFELLLIDDGSIDDSGAICEQYASKDNRIAVYRKVNGGASSARNVALSHVKGEWVAFCDSDDWVDDEWLMSFISGITPSSEALFVNSIKLVRESTIVGFKGSDMAFCQDKRTGIYILKTNDALGYLVNKIFNVRLIKENNIAFNESLRFREDEDFVLRYLLFIDNIIYRPEAYYNYNFPDLSNKYISVQMFDASLSMYKSIMDIYGRCDAPVCESYRMELINSFFDTYERGTGSVDKLKDFMATLPLDYMSELSVFTRIILRFPAHVCHLLLLTKSFVRRLFRRFTIA